MAGFIYFKPRHVQPIVSMQDIADWGLGYAFDVEPATREVMFADAVKGTLFGDETRLDGRTVGYYPDAQTWSKIPGSDCWVGYYNDAKPSPDCLLRTKGILGFTMPLNDGNTWSVPRVVQVVEGEQKSSLPCKLAVDDSGKICQGDPIDKHQYLWGLTAPYAKAFMTDAGEGDEVDLDANDALNDAVKLLQVNYRIALAEAIALDIFTEDVNALPMSICLLAIDYPTWIDWNKQQKKTDANAVTDGSSTADGVKDLPQDTIQPARTY